MAHNHGGARKNSGRLPVEDKKIQVYVFIPQSRVMLLGYEAARQIMIKAVEKAYLDKLIS